jgi:glycosyltransferase involved in cell wall biosynthesis
MKKVCHMTSAHNSNDVRIFNKECTSLAKAGYDTYLVARGESREENGVHVIGLGKAPQKRLSRMTSFAKKVYQKALEIDADIYHFHDPELLPYGIKLQKRGKKVVFDSHENYQAQIAEKEYFSVFVRQTISNLYYLYETYVTKKLDAVIIPCTFSKRDIFAGRAHKVVYIANYPLNSEFYDKYNPSAQKERYVCYMGSMSKANGITNLVRAAAQARVRLVLAGTFFAEAYKKEIMELPAYQNVNYLGWVTREQVASIYQDAMAGVYVNLSIGQNASIDAFGVKVYEYMASGLPVIVDENSFSKMVINTYHCGICINPKDIDAVAGAITYLCDHPREARQMGANGRRAVEQEFNWGTQEKKLLELYEQFSEEIDG